MKTLEHQDCPECRKNIEIIGNHQELISKKILRGMEKSGERVTVCAELKGLALCLLITRTKDLPETLSMNEEISTRYQECVKDLKPGEAIIVMATEGSSHIGIYKLPPGPMH